MLKDLAHSLAIALIITAAIMVTAVISAQFDEPEPVDGYTNRLVSAQFAVMWTEYLEQHLPKDAEFEGEYEVIESVMTRFAIPQPDNALLTRIGAQDRFGNAFRIHRERDRLRVISVGPDRIAGTEDDCFSPHQEYRKKNS